MVRSVGRGPGRVGVDEGQLSPAWGRHSLNRRLPCSNAGMNLPRRICRDVISKPRPMR